MLEKFKFGAKRSRNQETGEKLKKWKVNRKERASG
jgi:hypothetical protein